MASVYEADYYTVPAAKEAQADYDDPAKIPALIKKLQKGDEGLGQAPGF